MSRLHLTIILYLLFNTAYTVETDHTDYNGAWISVTEPYHRLDITDSPHSSHVFCAINKSDATGTIPAINANIGYFKAGKASLYTFFNTGGIFLKNGEMKKAVLEFLRKKNLMELRYENFKQQFKRLTPALKPGPLSGLWFYNDDKGYTKAIRLYHQGTRIEGNLNAKSFSTTDNNGVHQGAFYRINTFDRNIFKWSDRQVSEAMGKIAITGSENGITVTFKYSPKHEENTITMQRTAPKPTFTAPKELEGKWASIKDASATLVLTFKDYGNEFNDPRHDLMGTAYKSFINTEIKHSKDGTLNWRYSHGKIKDKNLSLFNIRPDKSSSDIIYYKDQAYFRQ